MPTTPHNKPLQSIRVPLNDAYPAAAQSIENIPPNTGTSNRRTSRGISMVKISASLISSISEFPASLKTNLGSDACKYEQVDQAFLKERELQTDALGKWGLFIIFASSNLCISSPTVWNLVLSSGYGTLIASSALAFSTYICFFCILLELMVMLPLNGGMAIFARTAFGPFAGFLVGSCEAWEYILFAAQGFWMIGSTCSQIFGTPNELAPLYWIPFAVIVLGANLTGVRTFVALCGALLFIAVFGGLSVVLPSLKYFDISKNALQDAVNLPGVNFTLANGTINESPSTIDLLFPFGTAPIWPAMVSMLWSISGLEMAPLCAEEGKDFVQNAPRLMIMALVSILGVLGYVIVLVPCVPPGISVLVGANNPLIDAFLASYGIGGLGSSMTASALYFVLYVPCILLFIAIYVYATSRQIFALSKVGYYPKLLAKVYQKTSSPVYALFFSMAMCLSSALMLQFQASGVVGEAFLNGSLLYAIIAYISVSLAYLQMRWSYPNLKRPFDLGPFIGPFCAIVTLTAYTAALVSMFYNQVFRETLYVCLAKLGGMLIMFVAFQRKNMVETPEEEFIQRYLNGVDEEQEEDGVVVGGGATGTGVSSGGGGGGGGVGDSEVGGFAGVSAVSADVMRVRTASIVGKSVAGSVGFAGTSVMSSGGSFDAIGGSRSMRRTY
ncbi:amino acid permease-domain-containing protein [Obelidium mucronatum]|nr:amino acid permease-domain-containing protein [Obelidium mucronatum]